MLKTDEEMKVQTSESMLVGSLLALVGGYLDAYSYVCRGGVFANAETGNIVLLALHLASFQWAEAARYLLPILAFAAGVIITDMVRRRKNEIKLFHWRQLTLVIEILMLLAAGLLPQSMNLVVNALISLTCGVQVCAFAKFHQNAMATTMCTGNLRTGTQSIYKYRQTGDRAFLRKGLLYYGCILWFILGAMLGGKLAGRLGDWSIMLAAGGLALVFVALFSESRKR